MFEVNEKEIEFTQDTEERRRWFRAASFSHPAKMVLGLQIYLIEHYTKVGETILDPMAGSGTVLVGCALGRNIICVELEEKFCDMMRANWEKIKSLGPMLGYKMGRAQILQGDARNIDNVLFHPPVDKIVTSPPYAESLDRDEHKVQNSRVKAMMDYSYTDKKHGKSTGQIASLPYGEISAVISSPPFQEAEIKRKGQEKSRKDYNYGTKLKMSSEHPDNISKLAENNYGDIDAVITSPPYEGSLARDRSQDDSYREDREKTHAGGSVGIGKGYQVDPTVKRLRKHGRADDKAGGPYGQSLAHPYSGATENIGNLKSNNYLDAMLSVYQNCHRVLKDGGLLCLVVKNFIRDKKIVRLDTDTIKLCEKAGFVLKERLKRKLTQQSFWRIIYARRFPNAPKIEFEDVLIFAKARPNGTV